MEAIFDDATAGRRPIETETAPFLPRGIEDGWKAAGQPALKYGVLFVTKEPDGRPVVRKNKRDKKERQLKMRCPIGNDSEELRCAAEAYNSSDFRKVTESSDGPSRSQWEGMVDTDQWPTVPTDDDELTSGSMRNDVIVYSFRRIALSSNARHPRCNKRLID
ncbi:hypothetical protein HPB51_016367 [Rhipicephalus microplus]|uniref:Uncharacterized protein n=1 Tax=Rhipicephalus microplus TaxID=6941 RepID=A0A9J6DHX0_RHIMP|nr:hypothetical protein HPB51_016367 [Rhipicephalus microplus]